MRVGLLVLCLAVAAALVAAMDATALMMLDRVLRSDRAASLAQRFPDVVADERSHIGFVPQDLYGLISGADRSGRLRFTLPPPGEALLFTTPDRSNVRAFGVVNDATSTLRYFVTEPFRPVPPRSHPTLVGGIPPRSTEAMGFGMRAVSLGEWQPKHKVTLTHTAQLPLTYPAPEVNVYPHDLLTEILNPSALSERVYWSTTPPASIKKAGRDLAARPSKWNLLRPKFRSFGARTRIDEGSTSSARSQDSFRSE